MLPPEPDADEPLPMLTSPPVPTDTVPVLKDKSPNTPELPALLFDTDTLPELMSVPTPDEIVPYCHRHHPSLLQLLRLCCHLPRPESSFRQQRRMTIQQSSRLGSYHHGVGEIRQQR